MDDEKTRNLAKNECLEGVSNVLAAVEGWLAEITAFYACCSTKYVQK